MIMVLGVFSGAVVYNQKLDLAHAAREGARFGAVPDTLEKRIATAERETLDQLTDRASTAAALDDLLLDSG